MNSKAFLIAVICGLLSALMLAAPFQFGAFGMMLFVFAATPVCVAALGFGTVAGLLSGIMGAIAVGSFMGIASGVSVLVFFLLPGIWAGHMAGLVTHDDGTERWFPLSEILSRLAFFAVFSVLATGFLNGLDSATLADMVRTMLTEMSEGAVTQNPELQALSENDLSALTAQVAAISPFSATAILLCIYILSLNLGARIARANGWMLRPKDDIPTQTGVSLVLVGIFAVALILSFFGGNLGLMAKVFVGGTGMALALAGFATLHFLTRGMAARGLILGSTYAFTILSLLPALAMLILGLAETLLGLRARRAAPPPST